MENNLPHAKETADLQLNEGLLRSGVKNALKRNDSRYFGVKYHRKMVGQTTITLEWSNWRNGILWWLQSVYVNPNRNRWIFRALFKYIGKLARKDPQVKTLRLYVMGNNKSGKSLSNFRNAKLKLYYFWKRKLQ